VDYAYGEWIVVGGQEGWRFGFNYTDWISKAGKIYVNDTLVFKYPIPTPSSFHYVVLLKNKKSYKECIVNTGRNLANTTRGVGFGFGFKLLKPKNYFFACGVGNGTHCNVGLMKFGVKPVVRLT
ncbi:hypothetical protein KI387_039575, partial [Taxus chinensis]